MIPDPSKDTARFSISPSEFKEIESILSEPLFRGIPLGHTQNDSLTTELLDAHGDWRLRTRLLNRARYLRYLLSPVTGNSPVEQLTPGTVLTTWYQSTPRIDDLLLPILNELPPDRRAVLAGRSNVRERVPSGTPCYECEASFAHDLKQWRRDYAEARPQLNDAVRRVARQFSLPRGAEEILRVNLLYSSQLTSGSLSLLERLRPAVVLTEFDRSFLWAPLILAAERLGIPTVTLVHGVMEQDAVTFTPVLADRIVCWGEVDRRKLTEAGVPAEKVFVGGCPRLSRDLGSTREEARARLSLGPAGAVALCATSPDWCRLELAETFCSAVDTLDAVTGLVRLHPSEDLSDYASVAARHPGVRFVTNAHATLDESLAASDLLVVRASGAGSDALVKRVPVIVANPDEVLHGHDYDLVAKAGCPHARTAGQLASTIRAFFEDNSLKRGLGDRAEEYVAGFCAAFGEQSAQITAEVVKDLIRA